jgi:hypothetical protein
MLMLMANDICVTFREEIYKNRGKEELLSKSALKFLSHKSSGEDLRVRGTSARNKCLRQNNFPDYDICVRTTLYLNF